MKYSVIPTMGNGDILQTIKVKNEGDTVIAKKMVLHLSYFKCNRNMWLQTLWRDFEGTKGSWISQSANHSADSLAKQGASHLALFARDFLPP